MLYFFISDLIRVGIEEFKVFQFENITEFSQVINTEILQIASCNLQLKYMVNAYIILQKHAK